jgi:hypothetical protein
MSFSAAADERIYTCEVRFKRKLTNGEYDWGWREKPVEEVISAKDEVYRCKDCKGAVRLNRGPNPSAHAVHKSRQDSEYCQSGFYFKTSTDGREPRPSLNPVK